MTRHDGGEAAAGGARWVLFTASLAVASVLAGCGGEPPDASTPRTIAVVGEASAAATPDIVSIEIGVAIDADTAAEALDGTAEAMTSVFEALDALDVAEADRRTQDVSLHPIYESVPGDDGRRRPQLVGYQASNTVRIVLRDMDGVGAALDQLTKAGSTSISRLSFDVSETQALRDEARRGAVADARRKAEMLAEEAGVELAGVLSISERGAVAPSRYGNAARAMAEAMPVAPGEARIHASVDVVWAIED